MFERLVVWGDAMSPTTVREVLLGLPGAAVLDEVVARLLGPDVALCLEILLRLEMPPRLDPR